MNDHYPLSEMPIKGRFELLESEKYEIAKSIINNIPMQIYKEGQNIIGQPDSGDWGGIYLEIKKNGIKRYWTIDMMKSNIPEYLHNLVDDITIAVARINN
jgi:hypothetical protein